MVEKRSGKDKGRGDRLAAALRDNLKRRKAQARAKVEAPSSSADLSPDASAEEDRRTAGDERSAPIVTKTPRNR